jgi:hypothetical protein
VAVPNIIITQIPTQNIAVYIAKIIQNEFSETHPIPPP